MYLSKLILNPKNRAVRQDIANPREMHRTVLQAFPKEPEPTDFRAKHQVLYRVELNPSTGVPSVLVQAATAPDWTFLQGRDDYLLETGAASIGTKDLAPLLQAIAPGQVLQFRLRANVAKRKARAETPEEERWVGKRVALRTQEEQLAWLARKGAQGGFALVTSAWGDEIADVRMRPENDAEARVYASVQTERLTFGSVLFEGRLKVTERESFLDTLRNGIGSGKAYGFGLLSVAPG